MVESLSFVVQYRNELSHGICNPMEHAIKPIK